MTAEVGHRFPVCMRGSPRQRTPPARPSQHWLGRAYDDLDSTPATGKGAPGREPRGRAQPRRLSRSCQALSRAPVLPPAGLQLGLRWPLRGLVNLLERLPALRAALYSLGHWLLGKDVTGTARGEGAELPCVQVPPPLTSPEAPRTLSFVFVEAASHRRD